MKVYTMSYSKCLYARWTSYQHMFRRLVEGNSKKRVFPDLLGTLFCHSYSAYAKDFYLKETSYGSHGIWPCRISGGQSPAPYTGGSGSRRPVHVGFVVDKLAVGQDYLGALRFSPVPCSLVYHMKYEKGHVRCRIPKRQTDRNNNNNQILYILINIIIKFFILQYYYNTILYYNIILQYTTLITILILIK